MSRNASRSSDVVTAAEVRAVFAPKKRTRRGNIPRESIKRLLKKGASVSVARSGAQQIRVARPSTAAVQQVAQALVEQISAECQRYLRGSKAKTTTEATLDYVIGTIRRRGLDADIVHAASFSGKPTLSRAGIVRVFKKHAGGSEARISEKAKTLLVTIVEQYIIYLGTAAGRYASAARRTTIKPVDLTAALIDA